VYMNVYIYATYMHICVSTNICKYM
jgi:hypothetical protein